MKFVTILAVAISTFSSPVLASDWVFVTRGRADAVGVDLDSVRIEGDRRVFWSVWVKITTHPAEGVLPEHDYTVRRDTIDCRADKIWTGATGLYMIGGGRPALTGDAGSERADIFPDSLADDLQGFVCEADSLEALKGYGVESAEQFARDRRSGFFPDDADWLAANLE
jgi:hypothetical protein